MRVALISVYSHAGCTLKDVAGGYGTVFDIGRSAPARLLQFAKGRVARLTNSWSAEGPVADGQFETVSGSFQGKKFNSPNDLVIHSNGNIYQYTDSDGNFYADEYRNTD